MASPSLQVRETVAKMYHRRGAEEATIRNVLKPKIYLISCCSTKPGTYPITINQCRFALTTDGDEVWGEGRNLFLWAPLGQKGYAGASIIFGLCLVRTHKKTTSFISVSGRPNNVLVVNYLVSLVTYLSKTVPASDAPSAIPAETDCFGQITSFSAENYSFSRNSSISVAHSASPVPRPPCPRTDCNWEDNNVSACPSRGSFPLIVSFIDVYAHIITEFYCFSLLVMRKWCKPKICRHHE